MRNDEAKLVVQDSDACQNLAESAEQPESIERIKRGLQDVAERRTRPLREFDEETRTKQDIMR